MPTDIQFELFDASDKRSIVASPLLAASLDNMLIAAILQNTNLDRQSLSYCVSLIENGVNPDALAVSLLSCRRSSCFTSISDYIEDVGLILGYQTVIKDLRERDGVATEPRDN